MIPLPYPAPSTHPGGESAPLYREAVLCVHLDPGEAEVHRHGRAAGRLPGGIVLVSSRPADEAWISSRARLMIAGAGLVRLG